VAERLPSATVTSRLRVVCLCRISRLTNFCAERCRVCVVLYTSLCQADEFISAWANSFPATSATAETSDSDCSRIGDDHFAELSHQTSDTQVRPFGGGVADEGRGDGHFLARPAEPMPEPSPSRGVSFREPLCDIRVIQPATPATVAAVLDRVRELLLECSSVTCVRFSGGESLSTTRSAAPPLYHSRCGVTLLPLALRRHPCTTRAVALRRPGVAGRSLHRVLPSLVVPHAPTSSIGAPHDVGYARPTRARAACPTAAAALFLQAAA
jgi:hypothetical protein